MPAAIELLQQWPSGPVALFCGGGWGNDVLLCDAVDVLAVPAGQWRGALADLDAFLQRHARRRCAGWLGYDLGLDVEAWPTALHDDVGAPVLHVAAFATERALPPAPVPPAPSRHKNSSGELLSTAVPWPSST